MLRLGLAWLACFVVTFLASGAIAGVAIVPLLGPSFGDLLRPAADVSGFVPMTCGFAVTATVLTYLSSRLASGLRAGLVVGALIVADYCIAAGWSRLPPMATALSGVLSAVATILGGLTAGFILHHKQSSAATAALTLLALCAPPAGAKFESDQYQLVLLRSAAGAKELSKEDHAELFKGHIGHFKKMAVEGKMAVAGPFGDQDDKTLEGLCLYRVGTVSEARTLAEQDPAVKAGQLKVEVMTWYVEKGALTFPVADKMRK
jgi:uncharacterized protein YciI